MKKKHLLLSEVQKLHQKGFLQEAKAGYFALLAQDPMAVAAIHGLGLAYAETGDLEKAQHYLEKAIALDPHQPSFALHLANVLKAQGLFTQAAQVLQNLVQCNPEYAPAFNNLGTIYFAQAKLREAVQAYQTAIDLRPDFMDAYYNLGLAFSKQNEVEKAQQAYEAVLALQQDHAGAQFQLACLLMRQDQYPEAIRYFTKLETAHPFHFETQVNLATSYLKLGQLNEAKTHYQKALSIQPTDLGRDQGSKPPDHQVLFNLGIISMQQGHFKEAIHFYLQVVAIQPNSFDAHNNLAFAYLMLQKNELALHHFREALRIEPTNESIQHTIHILTQAKNIATSPLAYVRTFFNSYADHFDAHLQRVLSYQVPQQMFAAFQASGLPAHGLRVLDLGCGTGLAGEVFRPAASHLVGVDISENMLAIAADKKIYHDLIPADISTFLQLKSLEFDLIIASDVLVYSGDLAAVFSGVAHALTHYGIFIFNAEINREENYVMTASGRFAHKKAYLDQLARDHHFEIVSYKVIPMRLQKQTQVSGHLYILRKTKE